MCEIIVIVVALLCHFLSPTKLELEQWGWTLKGTSAVASSSQQQFQNRNYVTQIFIHGEEFEIPTLSYRHRHGFVLLAREVHFIFVILSLSHDDDDADVGDNEMNSHANDGKIMFIVSAVDESSPSWQWAAVWESTFDIALQVLSSPKLNNNESEVKKMGAGENNWDFLFEGDIDDDLWLPRKGRMRRGWTWRTKVESWKMWSGGEGKKWLTTSLLVKGLSTDC